MEAEGRPFLLELSHEQRLCVLSRLSADAVLGLRTTCKTLRDEGRMDEVWKSLCVRDFFGPGSPLCFPVPLSVQRQEEGGGGGSGAQKQKREEEDEEGDEEESDDSETKYSRGGITALQLFPNVCNAKYSKSWEWLYAVYTKRKLSVHDGWVVRDNGKKPYEDYDEGVEDVEGDKRIAEILADAKRIRKVKGLPKCWTRLRSFRIDEYLPPDEMFECIPTLEEEEDVLMGEVKQSQSNNRYPERKAYQVFDNYGRFAGMWEKRRDEWTDEMEFMLHGYGVALYASGEV